MQAARFAGKINVPELLVALRNLGIRSLMVEGGARVIRSFLAEAGLHSGASEEGASDGVVRSAVDTVIITVAPTLVGRDGIGYGNELVGGEVRISSWFVFAGMYDPSSSSLRWSM